jgi:hypothetical protein
VLTLQCKYAIVQPSRKTKTNEKNVRKIKELIENLHFFKKEEKT